MSTDNHTPELPGQSTDVHPGAQPFWLPAGPVGVLLIHGFGGSVGDMRLLAEEMHRAGYSVFGMRIAGHGQTQTALRAATVDDWRESVFTAARFINQRCSKLIVFGVSFGGALAIDYAAHTQEKTSGLVIVNTPLRYQGGGPFQKLLLRLLGLVRKDLPKPGMKSVDRERIKKSGSAPAWPIKRLLDTFQFLERFVLPVLPRLTIPSLVIATAKDNYVDTGSAEKILARLSASSKKDKLLIQSATHRPWLDPDARSQILAKVTDWFPPGLAS